jgi:hypothetical protein
MQPVCIPVQEKNTIRKKDGLENYLEPAGVKAKFCWLHKVSFALLDVCRQMITYAFLKKVSGFRLTKLFAGFFMQLTSRPHQAYCISSF